MKHHTLKSFDAKMNDISNNIVKMGEKVVDSVHLCGKALQSNDEDLITNAKIVEKEINALSDLIEQQVTECIALMNPMAVDLRFITSALRIAISLERAGDMAKSITKRMVRLQTQLPELVLQKLQALVQVDVEMLNQALEAVGQRSQEKALSVWRRDDEADDLCRDALNAGREAMQANPNDAHLLMDVLFAAKNLERIADYATSLAKTVYYVESGERPKKSLLANETLLDIDK